ncbi:hypothetical protein LPU83_pLPU83d_0916 (plasmid) [Rhizobium favelukesii]|uniref:Methyl-accepting chemotaxis protein n=1 Tax=Rhizobium favelukesii TaxID=348824 RepID=W6S7X4_9HYPH|nr:hypothetical protein LPU83_pLPU83d_0916 [Rhizobium favelukesii]
MDQGTQKNAAMVVETTAASHALVSEVVGIAEMLREFNIGENRQKPTSRPEPAPALKTAAMTQNMTVKRLQAKVA